MPHLKSMWVSILLSRAAAWISWTRKSIQKVLCILKRWSREEQGYLPGGYIILGGVFNLAFDLEITLPNILSESERYGTLLNFKVNLHRSKVLNTFHPCFLYCKNGTKIPIPGWDKIKFLKWTPCPYLFIHSRLCPSLFPNPSCRHSSAAFLLTSCGSRQAQTYLAMQKFIEGWLSWICFIINVQPIFSE